MNRPVTLEDAAAFLFHHQNALARTHGEGLNRLAIEDIHAVLQELSSGTANPAMGNTQTVLTIANAFCEGASIICPLIPKPQELAHAEETKIEETTPPTETEKTAEETNAPAGENNEESAQPATEDNS